MLVFNHRIERGERGESCEGKERVEVDGERE